MKKPYIARYSQIVNSDINHDGPDTTRETRTIENDDTDKIASLDPDTTTITKSLENTDNDFLLVWL